MPYLSRIYILFMKKVALPCGKQHAIYGPTVNVPTDLTPVCILLPRLPFQAQMVPKEKIVLEGTLHVSVCIRPAKLLTALQWLKSIITHCTRILILTIKLL